MIPCSPIILNQHHQSSDLSFPGSYAQNKSAASRFGNMNANNGGQFQRFGYPQPNMLVQAGTRVRIHNLSPELGLELNGRFGKALEFFPDLNGSWSVQLEDDSDKIVQIRIDNLLYSDSGEFRFPVVTRDSPYWSIGSENGKFLLVAGTMDGHPALCLYDNPARADFDLERLYAQLPYMGVSKDWIQPILEQCQQHGIYN